MNAVENYAATSSIHTFRKGKSFWVTHTDKNKMRITAALRHEIFCSTSSSSRKTKVSHWLTRKIISASLRLRLQLGQSMCHQSCQKLLRGPADGGRKRSGVPGRNGWLPVLKNSKSWMRNLERLKGRCQGQRKARKMARSKKSLCLQIGNRVKPTMRTGNTAQKVRNCVDFHTVRLNCFILTIRNIGGLNKKFLACFVMKWFLDGSECPPDNSPGHSYHEEPGFSTYRGSGEDGQEPSSPSEDYSGRHPSKPIPPRFQKQPQHQQQVTASWCPL